MGKAATEQAYPSRPMEREHCAASMWKSSRFGIIVPGESTRVRKCNVPGCDAEFPWEERRQFINHVDKCSEVNEDKVMAEVEKNTKGNTYVDLESTWEEMEYMRRRKTTKL